MTAALLFVSAIERTSNPTVWAGLGAAIAGLALVKINIGAYVGAPVSLLGSKLQAAARYLDYHRSDLEGNLCEIGEKRPEIIIEDIRPQYSWLTPELNVLQLGFLDDYTVIVEENGIRILRLKASMRASPEHAGGGTSC